MLSLEQFHEVVLGGNYHTPAEHAPLRPLKRGFRAWWLFFVLGLGRAVRDGVRAIRKGQFTPATFSALAYDMTRAVESTGCPVSFEGFDSLKELKGKPFVAVANHTSLIETMLLPAALFSAGDVSVVAKKSLAKYPGFGAVLKSCHPILLERVNARRDLVDTLEQGEKLLRAGFSVLLFPQGHRSEIFNRKQFNSLGSKLAERAGVPLVAVACKTDFARPGWPLKDFGPVDPTRPVKFACSRALSSDVPQREMQNECVSFIADKLKEWGIGVV